MITLHLSPGDIEKVRFAFSPLIDLVTSFKVLRTPEYHAPYQAWVDEATRAFERIDFPYMDALILRKHYIADFLTPTPDRSIRNIEDEFDRVRETPDEVIRKNVQFTIQLEGLTPIRQMYMERPRESLECVLEELRFYWNAVLAPHWSQIASILEADVLFRAQALAIHGLDVMIPGVSERLSYRQGSLRIAKEQSEACHERDYHLKGEGVQFVPSIFSACGIAWQVAPEWAPMLIYGARGLGLWHQQPPETIGASEALALTLGASRARVLQNLVEPASTNDLAYRLNLTAGAVSQQLGRLSQAGLIESYRIGSKVFYRLSTRGERLLDVFVD